MAGGPKYAIVCVPSNDKDALFRTDGDLAPFAVGGETGEPGVERVFRGTGFAVDLHVLRRQNLQ